MTATYQDRLALARRTAQRWIQLDGVAAVVLGGSLGRLVGAGTAAPTDPPNDIDLYAYCDVMPNPADRLAAVRELEASALSSIGSSGNLTICGRTPSRDSLSK